MSFQLRPATPADVDLIVSLIRELAEYEREPEQATATPERIREHLFGARPYIECLVAQLEDGRPAGFAVFFPNYSTWEGRPGIYLEDLFVRPECRGLGVGKALLKELARLAIERGCGRLEWSVLDWNQPAIGFYRSLGARAMDEWTTMRLSGDALAQLGGA